MSSYVTLCLPRGSTLSFLEFKFTYMRANWGDGRPITVATYHHRSDIIWICETTKSFAGFLSCLLIRFVGCLKAPLGAGTTCEITEDANMILQRRVFTTNAWGGYQKTPLSAP